ncbi:MULTISPECIES: hypothetical protein [Sphingobacterium]|nr:MULTISPECIES: hypothetical protein [Sphingobacterium]
MKKQLITLFFICLSGIMVVLSCDVAAKEGENRIRVSGEGKIRIMPD